MATSPQASPAVVILNPAANHGRATRIRPLVERALLGGRGELVLTARPRHGEEIAREAAQAGRAVIIVGGDGTLAEAANGILSAQQPATVPLGLVAAGNGNDYAWNTLKLPHDPAAALEIALEGEVAVVDVGVVNERYFVNSLGIGIDANIAAAASELKRYAFLQGQTLYWAASLREIIFHYNRCPWLTIYPDGEETDGRLYALSAVTVGPTYGGGFRINPQADIRDGLFDLCTIVKPSKLRALRLLGMVSKGQHVTQPEVHMRHVRSIVLESQEPVFAHLDGEVIKAARFEAKLLPGALRVRIPKS
ncbi:MAG TPA: diacylglycerol kinase family protein [Ktedonobacterales bacterium]|nr:diacylglycerol kinase family protein [Ktedonobacterales bacterium]